MDRGGSWALHFIHSKMQRMIGFGQKIASSLAGGDLRFTTIMGTDILPAPLVNQAQIART
jgi:hypothetical protein